MKSRILGYIVLLFALVALVGCNGDGTGPSVYPVEVTPSSAYIAPGQTQTFTAAGGDRTNWDWRVSGGADIVRTNRFECTIRARNELGQFTITVESGGQTGQATFEVRSETMADLVSATPPAGSTVLFGQRVRFMVKYVTLQLPVKIRIVFYDEDGNLINGSVSSAAVLTENSGLAEINAGAGKVGRSGSVRIVIFWTDPYVEYYSKFVEILYDWQ